ncbi:hypothetical protein IIA15_03170 [candidate division TA06 bacterium]|nr:hypothetical protein [candidate division TA06 bacterium]
MIQRETLLVLGAGASVPYGFPDGHTLAQQIWNKLSETVEDPLKLQLQECGFELKEIYEFKKELQLSHQPSVDAFLENRQEYINIGKAAIAAKLIPYELLQVLDREGGGLKWYEYLFNQMSGSRNDFEKNNLSIVTLNYDRSLEYFLFRALKHSYGLIDNEAVDLLKSIPIIHLYGQLGKPDFYDKTGRPFTPEVSQVNIKKCIDEIQIFHELVEDSAELKEARELVSKSEILCFLGFGYHPENIKRLSINESFKGINMLGSVYQFGKNEINQVHRLLKGRIRVGANNENALQFLRNHPVFS